MDQIYINKMVNPAADPNVKKNNKNGCTLSIRKWGWVAAFDLAQRLAGWKWNTIGILDEKHGRGTSVWPIGLELSVLNFDVSRNPKHPKTKN